MIAGNFYITPHAVRQFQKRCAPELSYNQALGAVIRGLRENGGPPKLCSNGTACVIRVAGGQCNFRAVIDPRRREGPLPVVATILPGKTSKGGRRRR